jgi:septal ring-binding cell division protein DamX
MGAGKRSSAGERVLEGRHVIGLFFLMLLFSGVFFTLGYVMGKNQLDGQVRAASTHGSEPVLPLKPDAPKQGKSPVSTPDTSVPTSDTSTSPPSSEWEFYRAGEKKAPNDHLKPAPSITSSPTAPPKTIPTSARTSVQPTTNGKNGSPSIPKGGYLLQVAAVRSEADAVSLAGELRRKKFPAFVQTPQGDKYYRVQVGPYNDQKAMQTAKKGLETSGFKAIIKH